MRMPPEKLFVPGVVILLTLLSYFFFPNHTYLQSDTQIYIPILEHYWDASVLGKDLIVQNPHVSFTVYDEVALALRRLTGSGFEAIVSAQQLLFRALGFLGVYLIGTSFGLRARGALVVAAIHGLGAVVNGPAVLVMEYEPVPRGFALPLLWLAVGLAGHGRDLAAGVAASIAFLYHPPTVYPYWLAYFALALYPGRLSIMRRHLTGLVPLYGAVFLLFVLSRMQTGLGEPQFFFARLPEWLEQLQRMRASYNWVGMWIAQGSNPLEWWGTHYLFLWLMTVVLARRLWRETPLDLRFFTVGLPLVGVFSLPISYVLLDMMKWSLMPQLQPARAVLFIPAMVTILGAIAGVKAAEARRPLAAFLWFILAFAVPGRTLLQEVANLLDPVVLVRWAVVLLLAALGMLACLTLSHRVSWGSGAALLLLLVLPFLILPRLEGLKAAPSPHTPELYELIEWARTSTPRSAVFQFPGVQRALHPGVFRAQALRAVYADWKAGGQANYMPNYAREWYRRWQTAGIPELTGAMLSEWRREGIDYVVVPPRQRLSGHEPSFENAAFLAYSLRSLPGRNLRDTSAAAEESHSRSGL
jgi:hypothetical protein